MGGVEISICKPGGYDWRFCTSSIVLLHKAFLKSKWINELLLKILALSMHCSFIH